MNRLYNATRYLLLLLLALPVISGCGGGQQQGSGSGLSGAVRIDGSSTVYPITEAVAEEYMIENPGVGVTVGTSGSGGGFQKFIRKEIEISNASRPIKPSERDDAQKNGVTFIELPVAYDGLAVVVNKNNNFVDCLTTEELKKIWEPNSTVKTWNQVRSSFPNQPIRLYGPGTDSGTYDYFTDAINGKEGASRTDYTPSEDDNVLVQGVKGDQNALGYFGMAYYEANMNDLKVVKIDDGKSDNGQGCIAPSSETVRNNQYQPLSRPLFIYVRKDAATQPAIKSFVEYYIQNAGKYAPEVGYVPLSDQAYQMSLQRFRSGVAGSVFEKGGSQIGVSLEDLLKREAGTSAGSADTTR